MKNVNFQSILIILFFVVSFLLYLGIKNYQNFVIRSFLKQYPGLKKNIKRIGGSLLVFRYILYICMVVLLSISLLNPSFSEEEGFKSYTGVGVDILFIVDTSLSMNSVDTKPNRLGLFKETVLRSLSDLNGNRLGIIAFAGEAFLYCPMTSDITAFADYIRGLDVDMIPDSGTDIKAAFKKAEPILQSGKVYRNRLVVLVTDGENMENEFPETLDAPLFIWGIGTEAGGPIYYSDEETGSKGYITRDRRLQKQQGSPGLIISKLSQSYLQKLSNKHSATYIHLNRSNQAANILVEEIKGMKKNTGKRMQEFIKRDGYQYFLFPAFCLMVFDLLFLESLFKYLLSRKR